MSKILDHLKEVMENRKDKYIPELHPKRSPAEDQPTAVTTPAALAANNSFFCFAIGVSAFLGVVALILSFKAFSQIQKGNENVVRLGNIIVEQDKEIKSMWNTLSAMESGSAQDRIGLSSEIDKLGSVLQTQRASTLKFTTQLDKCNQQLNDVKSSHLNILGKITDINKEIRDLQNIQRAAKTVIAQ